MLLHNSLHSYMHSHGGCGARSQVPSESLWSSARRMISIPLLTPVWLSHHSITPTTRIANMRTIPAFPSLFSFLALARLTHSLENLGGENLKFIMISSLCSHHQCGISIQITFYYAPELYCLAFSHSHTLTHQHDSSTHSFLKKSTIISTRFESV